MATESSAAKRPDDRTAAGDTTAGSDPAQEDSARDDTVQDDTDRDAPLPHDPGTEDGVDAGGPGEPEPIESSDPVLADIGAALLHLRRVWARPDLMKRIRAQAPTGGDGRPLQISNLMVVNAVHSLTAAASGACAGPGGKRDEGPGLPPREITVGAVAERLEIDPSTASRLVGHAIDAGLLSRRPSPVDARRANLALTEAGRRVKHVADRFRRDYLNELMSGWTPEERSEFARLLTRFADAAARAPRYSDDIGRIFEEARAD